MRYSVLADAYEKLEATTKRLEMHDILVELFRQTPKEVVDKVVYLTQGKLHPDWMGMPEIGVAERMAIRALATAAGSTDGQVEAKFKELGDMGLVAEELMKNKRIMKLFSQPLTVERVYRTLDQIAMESGPGSVDRKIRRLVGLLGDASPKEAKYLMRTVLGSLRIGVGDMTVLDALAEAYTGSKENRPLLERAYNLTSDLGYVAKVVAEKGLEGIMGIKPVLGRVIGIPPVFLSPKGHFRIPRYHPVRRRRMERKIGSFRSESASHALFRPKRTGKGADGRIRPPGDQGGGEAGCPS